MAIRQSTLDELPAGIFGFKLDLPARTLPYTKSIVVILSHHCQQQAAECDRLRQYPIADLQQKVRFLTPVSAQIPPFG
jgi:hypothetical protein